MPIVTTATTAAATLIKMSNSTQDFFPVVLAADASVQSGIPSYMAVVGNHSSQASSLPSPQSSFPSQTDDGTTHLLFVQ